jgi:hypothetical protein
LGEDGWGWGVLGWGWGNGDGLKDTCGLLVDDERLMGLVIEYVMLLLVNCAVSSIYCCILVYGNKAVGDP